MSSLISLLILGCAPDTFSDTEQLESPNLEHSFERWNEDEIVSNRLLVQRRDGIRGNIRFKNSPLNLLRDMTTLDIQEIEVPPGVDYRDVLQELWDSGEYTIAEPVFTRSIPDFEIAEFSGEMLRAPNDPYYPYQYNMDIVQATDATNTGSNIVVAVIDTGVGTGGEDTPINMIAGYDFVNDDTDASDDQGHGTHVAGTIAQATNNGLGAIGVAPNVDIMPLKVLGADGSGLSSDTIAALEYALNNGADVVNLSLGATTASSGEEAAVDALVAAGVAVVAANGNDGIQNNGINYPAAYANSIAVSATDFNGTITDYSNAGPETDLAAPGGDISEDTDGDGVDDTYVDLNGDGQPDGILQETINGASYNYFFFEGTSMATPHVAGAFAAVMSAGASAADAETFLKSTAQDLGSAGVDNLYGHGEIRIQDAIDAYTASLSNARGINSLSSGDLIISEVMHNPEMVADYRGEWIEIYNNSGFKLDLNGLKVNNGVDAGITVGQELIVNDGEYVVLGVYAPTVGNGGYTPDYVYTYSDLRLTKNMTLTIGTNSKTFDSFTYGEYTHDTSPSKSLSLESLDPTDADDASNWCASTSTYGDGDYGTPGSANDTCPDAIPLFSVVAGDLIITEVMQDPAAVADYRGEWFEVYNNSGSTINLNGLTVNCGGSSGFTINTTTYIEPNDYYVFSVRSNALLNGGISEVDVEYDYASCSMAYTDSLSLKYGATTFDAVSWSSAFPFSTGGTMSLGSLDATANDSAANWCQGASTYGDGDIGTPGAANDSCPVYTAVSDLTAGDLVISEIMVDPTVVADYRGEWFEIYNNTADTVQLNGLEVGCGGNAGFTFTGSVLIESGTEALFAVNAVSANNGGMSNVEGLYNYASCAFTYNDSLQIGYGSTIFDSLSWTNSYPLSPGSSMTLGSLDATDNDSSIYWCEPTSTYGGGDVGTPGFSNDSCPEAVLSSSTLGAGDLVISEIMSNPVTVFDYRGEWFEIYNNSGFDVNLNGITFNSSNNSGFTLGENVVATAGSYTLFAVNGNSSSNGGLPTVDYAYSYGALSFGRQDDLTISVSGTTIDTVTITSAYPEGAGSSLSLNTLSATANDSASSWCESTSGYGSGEFGTPGSANDSCP